MALRDKNNTVQEQQADNGGLGENQTKTATLKPNHVRSKLEMLFLILIVMIGGGLLGITTGGIKQNDNPAKEEFAPPVNQFIDLSSDDASTKPELSQFILQPLQVMVQDNPCTMSLALVIRKDRMNQCRPILLRNSPYLKKWLTRHFNDLTIEQIRGATNFLSLRNDIRDNFNRICWPGEKGFIERVDFIQIPSFDR